MLCFTQCQVRPGAVLSRERMKEVTRDMLMTDAYLMEKNVDDSVATYYYESVLQKHHISRAKYDSSLVWYSKHSPLLNSIYDELLSEFETSTNLLDTAYMDSVSLYTARYQKPESDWTLRSRIRIMPSRRYRAWSIEMPSSNYAGGDTVELSVRTVPELRVGELLISRLFVQDSARYHVVILRDSLSHSLPGKHRFRFILPDSLPDGYSLSLQMMYINRALRKLSPLLLDSITLNKRMPPEPIVVESEEVSTDGATESYDSQSSDSIPDDMDESSIPLDSL